MSSNAGLEAAKRQIEMLPAAVTAALKEVARQTAERIKEGYQQRLLAQTKAVKTAASARVLDESDQKRFDVNVPGDSADPDELPFWLERGTHKMAAKPALRPAGDAENERYKNDMAAAAYGAAKNTLK